MAMDTPARIAILGAGPIGLEAALYARFLGYDVDIYEQGEVAQNVRNWGHVEMFSPFEMNRSPLGLAALAAQDDAYQPPADDALLTGREYAERYLLPLSQTDLLADHLRLKTTVVAISRSDSRKTDLPSEDRDVSPFLLLVRDDAGERHETADIVIDTTGVYRHPNWLGQGGIPAIGERPLRDRIEYGVPDVAGAARPHYANQHVLVVGSGYSAATTIVALHALRKTAPDTQVTWATRQNDPAPIPRFADDSLENRDRIAARANELATAGTLLTGCQVTAIQPEADGRLGVSLTHPEVPALTVDRIVANVGYRPDNSICEELQVHQCYASGGPMKLAAALLENTSANCLDQTSRGAASLTNPEPHFYILGAKSYGRNSHFLIAVGLEQIRELFALIGDRENLDLYATSRTLNVDP